MVALCHDQFVLLDNSNEIRKASRIKYIPSSIGQYLSYYCLQIGGSPNCGVGELQVRGPQCIDSQFVRLQSCLHTVSAVLSFA